MDARARLMKRVKTSCPLRSGGAANGQCPKNPMACASQDCIALLLRLTFDREEAAALLSRLAQVEHPEALEVGALYRRLAHLVRADERAATLAGEVERLFKGEPSVSVPSAVAPPPAKAKASLQADVDQELLVEKEQEIHDLRETVDILEQKIAKLEQLVRLKDAKIQKLKDAAAGRR